MTLSALILALQLAFGSAPTTAQVDAAIYQQSQAGVCVTNGGSIVVQDQSIVQ